MLFDAIITTIIIITIIAIIINTSVIYSTRANPDVSLNAGTAYEIYSDYGADGWVNLLGTTPAEAIWGGLIAIVDDMRVTSSLNSLDGPRQLLPALYVIYNRANYASDFHDITRGATTVGKPRNSSGSRYNLVTGIGTPIAQTLIPALVNAQ